MHVNLDAEGKMLGCLLLLLPTQIMQQYDRIKDVTTLRADVGEIYEGSKYTVALHLFARYDGNGRGEKPDDLMFYFRSISTDGWQYLDYHPIVLLLDNTTRLRFDPKHDGDVQTGQLIESMFVHPTDSEFRQVSSANTVEGVIGSDQFKFTQRQRDLIKRYANYIADPTAEIKQPVDPEDETRKFGARRAASSRSESATPKRREPTEAERKAAEEERRKQKATSYFNIAENLRKSKKYPQARKMYEEVIRDFSKYPEAKMAKERLNTLPKQ